MRTVILSVVVSSLVPVVSWADGWELTLLGGWTAPLYEQRFSYRPDIDLPDIPGAMLRQEGEFALDARGSFAFGGSLAYYFNDFIALEGRVDTVGFDIQTEAPVFTATVPLQAPLPDATVVLDLGTGTVDVERLYPISFNLKARTGGRVRFVASGGVSYLPKLRLEAVQTASLSANLLGIELVQPVTVSVMAEALPDEEGEGRLGFNGGAGIEVQLSEKISFVGEVRFFRFQTQTFVWRSGAEATSELEELLLEELENELEPLELEPTYFQASGGFTVRF